MGTVVIGPMALKSEIAFAGAAAGGDLRPAWPVDAGGRPPADGNGNPKYEEGHSMAAERPNADQWSRVKQRLRTELGEDVFTSWFARIEFEEADGNLIYLSVPTRFLKSWILSHYRDRLVALWNEERGEATLIEIIVRGAVRARPQARGEADKAAEAPVLPAAPPSQPASVAIRRAAEPEGGLGGSPVDPRYTFETFCEGAANRVAYAAARAVAETPSGRPSQFNPLYIHAGVAAARRICFTPRRGRRGAPSRAARWST